MKAAYFFVLLALSSAATAQEEWKPPKWYRGHEGPQFEVLKTQDEVDQRHYPAGKWVAITVSGQGWDDAIGDATKKLDDYWKGGNQPQQKIDTTVPTFTIFTPSGQGQAVETSFAVEYFLPRDLHASPPAPTAQELSVVDVPEYNVWVRVFGGWAKEKDILDQGFGFMQQLKDMGVKIREDQFGFAQYDEATHLVNRHNEIWVWEQEEPSHPSSGPSMLHRMVDKVRRAFPWRT